MLAFCFCSLSAQSTFSLSYPASPDTADGGANIVLMDDGYLIGCGTVNQQNGKEYSALLKIDWNGDYAWSKSYYWEPYQPDIAYDNPIAIASDKVYMVCQTDSDSTQKNFQLFCLNPEGDTLWSQIYAKDFDDIISGMMSLSDSTLLLYGMEGTTDVLNVARLVKVGKDGIVFWDKTYGDEFGRSALRDVKELPDSSLIMASVVCHYGSNCLLERYPALTKVDKDGNKLWTKTYNESESYLKALVTPLDDGGYALAWTRDTFFWTVDPYPPVIYFLDSLGNIESEYDGFVRPGNYYMTKLKRMSNGDILGVGITLDFSDGETYGGWLFRMTQEGELVWERKISDRRYPDLYGQFFDAIETPDGGIIAVGNISTNGFQNAEVWIVKLDGEGCMVPGCTGDSIFITPVKDLPAQDNSFFTLSPNPSGNNTNASLWDGLNLRDCRVKITNLSGQLLTEIVPASFNQQLSTDGLPNGVYLVQLEQSGRLLQSQKLVVIR